MLTKGRPWASTARIVPIPPAQTTTSAQGSTRERRESDVASPAVRQRRQRRRPLRHGGHQHVDLHGRKALQGFAQQRGVVEHHPEGHQHGGPGGLVERPAAQHGSSLEELPLMQAAGMTPEQVLVAATSGAAQLLGFGVPGRLAPGFRADVVLVDGDARDLAGLPGAVREVWKGGAPRIRHEAEAAPAA